MRFCDLTFFSASCSITSVMISYALKGGVGPGRACRISVRRRSTVWKVGLWGGRRKGGEVPKGGVDPVGKVKYSVVEGGRR